MADLLWFFAISTCLKLLLIPSYRSTDFEVHRNWLALTHSLPLSQWYFDETSPWTLDYPPLFAYFERFLSIFAYLIDPQMIDQGFGFEEANFDLGIGCLVPNACDCGPFAFPVQWVSVGGFVDLAFVFGARKGFGWHYCWCGLVKGLRRLSVLGAVVVAVFAVAYGPFIYHGQIQQVLRRMFPFGRGLCHAYWAPNFWVFYIILDKGLAFLLRKLGFAIQTPEASFTGGLVGDSSPFAMLPQITPLATFAMVLLALSPCLIKAWRDPRPGMISRWVTYAYTCGFLFGWHVHEKASLHFVIPLAFVAVQSLENARHYFWLSIVSCYSLFPLLFEAQEYPIKVLLLLLHSIIMWLAFSAQFTKGEEAKAAARIKKKDEQLKLKGNSNRADKKEGFVIGGVEKSYLKGALISAFDKACSPRNIVLIPSTTMLIIKTLKDFDCDHNSKNISNIFVGNVVEITKLMQPR
ncbi:hypothetical protein CMV_004363 [Castanea mollissima]|uniref:Alpha-1,3-glucosyltransferase n=1 Tax=Castanea mollissima TaxID=60419 RepID=A0A8J4RSZ0_9ROSI|nr:hypothetical protein CMV_004363 [Castanea mollissima]